MLYKIRIQRIGFRFDSIGGEAEGRTIQVMSEFLPCIFFLSFCVGRLRFFLKISHFKKDAAFYPSIAPCDVVYNVFKSAFESFH